MNLDTYSDIRYRARLRDVVTYSAISHRARLKLQADAVDTSILGRLCAQVPEVFETHVMPHLSDRDLLSLAFLGGEPRRVMRGSSRAPPTLSRHPWIRPMSVVGRLCQELDRFVGLDPDGDVYCRRCRLKCGPLLHVKKTLRTLPALHNHAKKVATFSNYKKDRDTHARMFQAIDDVLRFATETEMKQK